MDDTQDNQDGRWLTYAELATIRGIGRASAVKLVQRERWRRSSGNDRARTIRVLVPPDWLALAKERPASSDAPAMSGEYSGMMAGALAALETAVMSLTERAQAAERRADMAETGRGEERARAERAEAAIADAASDVRELRAHATALQVELAERQTALDRTQAEARAARERAEALQREDDARKARGLLARLRAAVRGR